MPIIETGPYTTNYLVYDAPVNEKTKKIREMFKVDEETGYPEKYNWRGMAKLGSSYKPSAPFACFKPYSEEEYYSTKIFIVSAMGLAFGMGYYCWNTYKRRPLYTGLQWFLIPWGLSSIGGLYYLEKSLEREGIKQKMYVDYTEKHSERFGEIKRPKMREVLFRYFPCR